MMIAIRKYSAPLMNYSSTYVYRQSVNHINIDTNHFTQNTHTHTHTHTHTLFVNMIKPLLATHVIIISSC
jgi:hypothetical protein